MIERFTSGGGSAGYTIEQASGENDGPSMWLIGAVLIAAYWAYNQVM